MKQKISGISGPGLVILLLVSLFSWATPVSAGTACWSAESIPSMVDYALGPAGIDVRDIAVAAGGATIYAVASDDVSDDVFYKSSNTGVSWAALNVNIEADLVAVAPDDEDVVAIASSSTPEVYLTISGGSTWYNLGTPQESGAGAAATICDIAISKESEGVHYIAVAGKEAGDVANVWYFASGDIAPTWKETNTLPDFGSANEVAAVAFSPSFPEDEVMVAISEKDNASVNLQIFSFSYNKWNVSANFVGYPVNIIYGGGITGLTSASIAMDPDYMADDYDSRIIFVGVAVSGSASDTSGIYRLVDNKSKALKANTRIHSIDFDGTNLVAGDYDTTTVYRSGNPLVTTPTVSDVSYLKKPGGEEKVVVAWAGGRVVAGTSGNESAFAISRDNGTTFNDISLIDTVIFKVRDVAVSANGGKVYLVTDDGTDLSLWRKVSSWQRVLSRQGTTDYIVRIAPEDTGAVYVAKRDGSTIYYNRSSGDTEWLTRTCGVGVQDLAVEGVDVAYALNSSGSVSKTIDAGFAWGTAVSTQLGSGATIVSVSRNNLLVGSHDGYVAYSTDGSSSWTKIPNVLQSGARNVQVIADEGYATNKIIYAASDKAGQDIKKWEIGTSTKWVDIFRSTVPGGIYGLAMDDGMLYALEFNYSTGQSTLWRCLTPTTATSTSDDWSSSTTTASTDADDDEVHLNATPRALKISSGKPWAVKINLVNKLYSFTDILVEVGLMKPVSGFVNRISSINGLANDMAFIWERPSEATEYELNIAYDKDFFSSVTTVTVKTEESSVTVLVGPYQTGAARVNFMAGTTYYWRVRTTQPLYSLYSQYRSFTIEPIPALVPELLAPANGSVGVNRKPSFSWGPVSSASEYQFVLSGDTTLTSPIVDTEVKNAGFAMTEELDYGSTYFWKVRATEPVESGWSILANFTVREEPTEPVPLLVVPQAPPPVINVLEPPPPNVVTVSLPPSASTPSAPGYIRVIIIIASLLLLAVIALIIKPFIGRPVRVPEGFSDRLGKLREGLATYFKDFNLLRTFRGAKASIAETDEVEASNPISFAAESFIWMTTSEGKEGGQHLLSADEEQTLGKTLASRIQVVAKDRLLYHRFPKDAALLLYLWSQYGSRDETNRYLTESFQSTPENVIGLLKCYLIAPGGLGLGPARRTEFSRTQYDSLARVVDPDEVYEALRNLYGIGLDTPESEESGDSSDKAIAFQFARIHHLVKSELEKAGEVAPPGEAGVVRADAR